jgi:hypothetical protein
MQAMPSCPAAGMRGEVDEAADGVKSRTWHVLSVHFYLPLSDLPVSEKPDVYLWCSC